jgi:Flp pilus assembly protein TadD
MNIASTYMLPSVLISPPLLIFSLGRLLEKSDIKGAEKCYRDALAIDKNNASAHNCLGVVLEVRGCLKNNNQTNLVSLFFYEHERT